MATHDDAARRAYWAEQMDEAYAFMGRMMDYPVQECGEAPASLLDAVAAAGVEVEFSTSKIVDDIDRQFYLRAGLIDDFIAIARAMNARGWVMRVEDGYRTTAMQKKLAHKPGIFDTILRKVIWECDGATPSGEFLLRRISSLVATAPKVGTHMSCSAIDISVLRRDDRSEIDRGRPYLECSELTPMTSPFITAEALANRRAITELMESHGFMAYPYEFWHYNKGDAYAEALNNTGQPARYGAIDWTAPEGAVTPCADPCALLHDPADMVASIQQALANKQL